MYINLVEDDQITLTIREISVLLALVAKPLDGQDIARTCAADAQTATHISNGTLYPTLKRLERASLICKVNPTGATVAGKTRTVYQLTSTGSLILSWEAESLRTVADLAQKRLAISGGLAK